MVEKRVESPVKFHKFISFINTSKITLKSKDDSLTVNLILGTRFLSYNGTTLQRFLSKISKI